MSFHWYFVLVFSWRLGCYVPYGLYFLICFNLISVSLKKKKKPMLYVIIKFK